MGIRYNFIQTGQFNFYTGFDIRYHNVVTKTFINSFDNEFDNSINIERVDSPYWNYFLPVGLEYNKFLFKDFAISFNIGYEFMYYATSPEDTVIALSIDETPIIQLNERERDNNISGGFDLGAGFYFKTGNILMRLGVKYHKHTGQAIIFKRIDVRNLQVSPDSRSVHGFGGDYLSFNLAIHPQGWFKRKNRSTSSD